MKHMIRHIAASALVAGATALGTAAHAGPINPAEPSSVTIAFDNPIFTQDWYANVQLNGVYNGRVMAGRFSGTATELENVTEETFVDGVDQVLMYCFDLLQTIRPGETVNYDITFSPVEFNRTLGFIGAVNHYLNTERGTLETGFDPYAWVRPDSRAQSVAIQLGLWETKYDSGWNLGDGAFSASSVPQSALNMLGNFGSRYLDPANTIVAPELVMVLTNDERQDMIAADPPTQVPAPGTTGMLALGLVFLRRKRPWRKTRS